MTRGERGVTLRCKVTLTQADRGRIVATSGKATKPDPSLPVGPRRVINPSDVPRVTRSLVLGHHFERLVRDGVVRDHTELARRLGLSKARVSQLINLTLLAPDIQSRLLQVHPLEPRGKHCSERWLRKITPRADWEEQRALSEGLQSSR